MFISLIYIYIYTTTNNDDDNNDNNLQTIIEQARGPGKEARAGGAGVAEEQGREFTKGGFSKGV